MKLRNLTGIALIGCLVLSGLTGQASASGEAKQRTEAAPSQKENMVGIVLSRLNDVVRKYEQEIKKDNVAEFLSYYIANNFAAIIACYNQEKDIAKKEALLLALTAQKTLELLSQRRELFIERRADKPLQEAISQDAKISLEEAASLLKFLQTFFEEKDTHGATRNYIFDALLASLKFIVENAVPFTETFFYVLNKNGNVKVNIHKNDLSIGWIQCGGKKFYIIKRENQPAVIAYNYGDAVAGVSLNAEVIVFDSEKI